MRAMYSELIYFGESWTPTLAAAGGYKIEFDVLACILLQEKEIVSV